MMVATAYVGDSPWFPMDYLLRLIRVVVMLSIWRLILANRGPVSGMTLASVLTYTLIAESFGEILECRTELPHALWDGSIGSFFLQPMSLVGQAAARTSGRWAFGLCFFSAPLLLVAPLLGVNPWPVTAGAAGWFLVSLALAVSVGLAIEFIFLALTAALDQTPWGIESLRGALTAVLSGALVPLALMPWGIGDVFTWLPYASMASTPLRLYTGTGDPLVLIPLQVAWSIVLWLVASWLWRSNREKLASYGG